MIGQAAQQAVEEFEALSRHWRWQSWNARPASVWTTAIGGYPNGVTLTPSGDGSIIVLPILAGIATGILDEWFQWFVPVRAGEIRDIHVREGMRVPAGAPLVTLALAQGTGMAPQLADLARQDAELQRQQELADALHRTDAGTLARQRINLSAAVGSLQRQRALAAGQVRLAEADARRAAALAAEGAGTQRQVEESRGAVLARRAELEGLTERIIAQRDQLRAVDAQLAQGAIETERSRSDLAARRAALAEQRSALTRLDRIVLTAPVAGTVEQVGGQIGQRAHPEAALVTLVPAESRIEVWLYAPSRAVGFVRPGQEVRLQFDAFPHQTYGAGRGTVTCVWRCLPMSSRSRGRG